MYNISNKLEIRRRLTVKRVGVITDDAYLFQKINLALRGFAKCEKTSGAHEQSSFDLCLFDADTGLDTPTGALTMSREKECDLRIPFLTSDLLSLFEHKRAPKLDEVTKTVHIGKVSAKLTDLEFELLSLLLSERRFFSKEEILDQVWQNNADEGIVNVYIHYLREKLEADGEKVIICARNKGYGISEKFMGREDE